MTTLATLDEPMSGTTDRNELRARLAARTLRVAVLCGGTSSEREVSLRSGAAVTAALGRLGFPAVCIDLTTDSLRGLDPAQTDCCFLALHGGWGEDGGVQRALETLGLPFTGSGVAASRVAMDKISSKIAFAAADVPSPEGFCMTPFESGTFLFANAHRLGLPIIVKPRAQGSSVGVSVHYTFSGIACGLLEAFRYGPEALVERGIIGTEVTVGVLGESALPLIQMEPTSEFFDYRAKYEDPSTKYIVDPPLPAEAKSAAQTVSITACKALGVRGLARVDVMLDETWKPWVLEVNTLPGLTERSLFPKAALAAGLSFESLCETILKLGLAG
ncbi:MAG: D-alanine--D-alanine ligase [Planctomycetes bacterium]|nr:D-alanine--D-alanine ligase [Planctomycetota bacterium]